VLGAVLDVHARYAWAIDGGDAEAWAECFTADGVLRTSRPLEIRGRHALREFAQDWHVLSPAPRRHVSWNLLLGEAHGELSSRCYAALLTTCERGVAVEFTARYRDVYAHGDGGLLLAERVVEIDRHPRWLGR
jgi:SnoaL-like domain